MICSRAHPCLAVRKNEWESFSFSWVSFVCECSLPEGWSPLFLYSAPYKTLSKLCYIVMIVYLEAVFQTWRWTMHTQHSCLWDVSTKNILPSPTCDLSVMLSSSISSDSITTLTSHKYVSPARLHLSKTSVTTQCPRPFEHLHPFPLELLFVVSNLPS